MYQRRIRSVFGCQPTRISNRCGRQRAINSTLLELLASGQASKRGNTRRDGDGKRGGRSRRGSGVENGGISGGNVNGRMQGRHTAEPRGQSASESGLQRGWGPSLELQGLRANCPPTVSVYRLRPVTRLGHRTIVPNGRPTKALCSRVYHTPSLPKQVSSNSHKDFVPCARVQTTKGCKPRAGLRSHVRIDGLEVWMFGAMRTSMGNRAGFWLRSIIRIVPAQASPQVAVCVLRSK